MIIFLFARRIKIRSGTLLLSKDFQNVAQDNYFYEKAFY